MMKKILSILLCMVILLAFSACGKDDEATNDTPLRDIPTAGADQDKNDHQGDDLEAEDESEDEESSEPESAKNPDRTEESDRSEIAANLRDAQELIESGNYDDASMIIKGLKTRDLTDAEQKELNKLQEKMLQVSD